MTWSIEWSAPAITGLLAVSPHQAQRIDAAVQKFAATGEGNRFRLEADDAMSFRLRVPPHVVRLSLDRGPKVVRVWYLYQLS